MAGNSNLQQTDTISHNQMWEEVDDIAMWGLVACLRFSHLFFLDGDVTNMSSDTISTERTVRSSQGESTFTTPSQISTNTIQNLQTTHLRFLK